MWYFNEARASFRNGGCHHLEKRPLTVSDRRSEPEAGPRIDLSQWQDRFPRHVVGVCARFASEEYFSDRDPPRICGQPVRGPPPCRRAGPDAANPRGRGALQAPTPPARLLRLRRVAVE